MENYDDAVAFAKEFLGTNILLEDLKAIDPLDSKLPDPFEALRQATIDPDRLEYDVLVTTAAMYLRDLLNSFRDGSPVMPIWLANFAADVLEGKRTRPSKRGPDKDKYWERDYSLYRATREVGRVFKLPHYTNNELSEKITAAEIVSQAFGCKTDVVIRAYRKFRVPAGDK